MKAKLSVSLFLLAASPSAFAGSCSIAQVMTTLHSFKAYAEYEYAGNYDQSQGPPTLKRRGSKDQYLFWVDKAGQTYPAIVTYAADSCVSGTAVVKTSQGE